MIMVRIGGKSTVCVLRRLKVGLRTPDVASAIFGLVSVACSALRGSVGCRKRRRLPRAGSAAAVQIGGCLANDPAECLRGGLSAKRQPAATPFRVDDS